MGAEVIIFGQSLNSQFLKGLTHSAMDAGWLSFAILPKVGNGGEQGSEQKFSIVALDCGTRLWN